MKDVCVGDLMITKGDDIYIVAAVSEESLRKLGVTLIQIPGGNRYSGTVPVEHLPMRHTQYSLTPDQIEHLCGGYSDSFIHVKRGDYSFTLQYNELVPAIKRMEVK